MVNSSLFRLGKRSNTSSKADPHSKIGTTLYSNRHLRFLVLVKSCKFCSKSSKNDLLCTILARFQQIAGTILIFRVFKKFTHSPERPSTPRLWSGILSANRSWVFPRFSNQLKSTLDYETLTSRRKIENLFYHLETSL